MEISIELALFLIIGSVAILSAVMMLISDNAVHSALFLVLNFACVAFFYLMLDAAFLAMVQIAVYAGAIMVLFMFVIMLLGAEKDLPETKPRYPWLQAVAVGLSAIFLITASVGVLEAEIAATDPEPLDPHLRVVNATHMDDLTLLLNGEPFWEGVATYEHSDYQAIEAGAINLTVEGHEGEEAIAYDVALLEIQRPFEEMNVAEATLERLAEGNTTPPDTLERLDPILSLEGNETLTLVLTQLPDGAVGIIPVAENLFSVNNDKAARFQFVHAVPGAPQLDLADITEPENEPFIVAEDLMFGEFSDPVERPVDSYRFGAYPAGTVQAALDAAADDETLTPSDFDPVRVIDRADYENDTSTLMVIAPPRTSNFTDQPPQVLRIETDHLPSFGGPASIGQRLFTGYMLPFQAIALLLLVAMIGAIVMTRDAVPPPTPRQRRRLAATSDNPLVAGLVGRRDDPGGEPAQD